MYAHELYEQNKPRVVVTYPGRFQPFHQGHAGVFAQLQKKFGRDSVYILTSNDTNSAKSPFNFSDKYQLMTAAGVPGDKIIETNQMYKLPDSIDAANTIFITAVGAPDADRLNPDTYTKRDQKDKEGNITKPAGSPSYYKIWNDKEQPVTADQHGYVIVIPEIHKEITIKGRKYDVSHGTECRNLWNTFRNDPKARKEFLSQMYTRPSQELAVIFDKIPQATAEDISADSQSSTSPIHGADLKQGVAEDTEMITELRNRMYQYIKSILPKWPEYVLKDWVYGLARGDHQAGVYFKPDDSFDRWGFNRETILKMIANHGLSPDTQWQLIPNVKFTMDMFEPNSKRKLIGRAGGHSDMGMGITKDKERHATQAALAQKQGGVRKEPVILIKTPQGYELLEGWHRTIQHFVKYPDGYVGPAYVAVAQSQQGVAEGSQQTQFTDEELDAINQYLDDDLSFRELRTYPGLIRKIASHFGIASIQGHSGEMNFYDRLVQARAEGDIPEQGVAEGNNQSSAKTGIYQSEVFGAKAYHSKCLEKGCDWESRRFDRIKQAQDAAKKHAQTHIKSGVAEGLDPVNKRRLYDLIELYRDATDPSDYYDRDLEDPDEVIAMIRSEFGDKIANQVEAGADKMHYPRHDIQRSDPLGWKKPVDRITKAGKMYKQDSDYMKNTIKARYKNSGKSATEGVAEDAAGVGVVAKNKKMAKDPRYSMSITKDVKPSTPKNMLRAFRLSEDSAVSEEQIISMVKSFLPLAMRELKLKKLPKIVIKKHIETHDGQATFGRFANEEERIYLGIADRHPVDILRTLAHELVHFKQHEQGRIEPDSGDTGSPIENEANAVAGVLMRYFNKKYPNAVKSSAVSLDESLFQRYQQFKENGDEADEIKKQKNLIPFPKGTVKVDVSDVYDWYKIGQEISDLDDADPADFGKGPPQTVMAFGSEPEEHRYLKDLKRLGLKTHDIDENFADGRNPQDKGDSKRYNVPTKGKISTLRKIAKQGGRRGQLAHWMANMRSGKNKK